MKKAGATELLLTTCPSGSVIELNLKEKDNFIIPESVCLTLYGEPLIPTHFDAHGNPQIGGLACRMLGWKLRRLVHNSVIKGEYSAVVDYQYEVTSSYIPIPITQRLPRAEVCPVCGREITVVDLNMKNTEEIDGCSAIVHKACANQFYRAMEIDEIAKNIKIVLYDEEDGLTWGKGARSMHYETFIPDGIYDPGGRRPWILLHLPIGDIAIGRHDRAFEVAFMENFVSYDHKIFGDKYGTGFTINNTYSLLARNDREFRQCLRTVRDAVLKKASQPSK